MSSTIFLRRHTEPSNVQAREQSRVLKDTTKQMSSSSTKTTADYSTTKTKSTAERALAQLELTKRKCTVQESKLAKLQWEASAKTQELYELIERTVEIGKENGELDGILRQKQHNLETLDAAFANLRIELQKTGTLDDSLRTRVEQIKKSMGCCDSLLKALPDNVSPKASKALTKESLDEMQIPVERVNMLHEEIISCQEEHCVVSESIEKTQTRLDEVVRKLRTIKSELESEEQRSHEMVQKDTSADQAVTVLLESIQALENACAETTDACAQLSIARDVATSSRNDQLASFQNQDRAVTKRHVLTKEYLLILAGMQRTVSSLSKKGERSMKSLEDDLCAVGKSSESLLNQLLNTKREQHQLKEAVALKKKVLQDSEAARHALVLEHQSSLNGRNSMTCQLKRLQDLLQKRRTELSEVKETGERELEKCKQQLENVTQQRDRDSESLQQLEESFRGLQQTLANRSEMIQNLEQEKSLLQGTIERTMRDEDGQSIRELNNLAEKKREETKIEKERRAACRKELSGKEEKLRQLQQKLEDIRKQCAGAREDKFLQLLAMEKATHEKMQEFSDLREEVQAFQTSAQEKAQVRNATNDAGKAKAGDSQRNKQSYRRRLQAARVRNDDSIGQTDATLETATAGEVVDVNLRQRDDEKSIKPSDLTSGEPTAEENVPRQDLGRQTAVMSRISGRIGKRSASRGRRKRQTNPDDSWFTDEQFL